MVLFVEKGRVSPTIRAEMGGHPPIVMLEQIYLESHPNDSRIGIEDSGTSQTLSSRMGTGGGNTPMMLEWKMEEKVRETPMEINVEGYAFDNEKNEPIRGRYVVRRITPKECERLQGFPDNYTDIGEWTDQKGKKRMTTDAARYKALGNSMAVPVMKFIAQRIDWALAHPITENTAEALDWQPSLF